MSDPLPSPVPPDLASLLAKLRAVLVHSCGHQLGRVLVGITYEISREGVCWTLPANGAGRPEEAARLAASDPGPTFPAAEDDLSILRVLLTESPLMAKQIANRLRVPNNATLRGRLANLRRARLLSNEGRGYALTEAGRRAVGAPAA